MTDKTSLLSTLPGDLLIEITSYLKALDPAYLELLNKMHIRQKEEIAYLKKHHPDRMEKYEEVLQDNAVISPKFIEERECILDKLNCEIIEAKININYNFLMLIKDGITRFPVSLFQKKEYVQFFENLIHLDLEGNQLASLDLRHLLKLEWLRCDQNSLNELNIQGLKNLKHIDCHTNNLTKLELTGLDVTLEYLFCYGNKITSLDLKGFRALNSLYCDIHMLNYLNLTDASDAVKNSHGAIEQQLLFKQYAYDTVNSIISKAASFLPSFLGGSASNAKNKRPRNEDGMEFYDSEEESNHEPEFKRHRHI